MKTTGHTPMKEVARYASGSHSGVIGLGFAADYSAGWIAPVGQASAQVPQSAHISGSI